MPINREKEFIFIHIPKVAGTSLEKALNIYGDHFAHSKKIAFGSFKYRSSRYALQHVAGRHLIALDIISEDDYKNFYKFSFVRNPWERAVSDYNWQKSIRKQDFTFTEYLLQAKKYTIDNGKNRNILAEISHYVPQSWFLYTSASSKKPEVDFVGRFENFQKDCYYVLKKIDMAHINLNSDNRGKFNLYYFYYFNLKNYYLIKEIYKEDITRFNYSFFKSNAFKLFIRRVVYKISTKLLPLKKR